MTLFSRNPDAAQRKKIMSLIEKQDPEEGVLHELTLFRERGDEIIATATCYPFENGPMMVDFIHVDAGEAHMRMAIYRDLISDVRRIASEEGCPFIYMTFIDEAVEDLCGGDIRRAEFQQSFFKPDSKPHKGIHK